MGEIKRIITDMPEMINVSDEGTIVYNQTWVDFFEKAGGDFEELMLIVEDHIYQDDEGFEVIDYDAVMEEYLNGNIDKDSD